MQDDLRNRGNNLPWWEFLLVKNSAEIGGINAVVFRVEHCLADGMSLAKLFEGFLTTETGDPVNLIPKSLQQKKEKKKKQSKFSLYSKILPSLTHVLGLAKTKFDHSTMFSKSSHGTMTYNGNRSVILFPTTPLQFIKDIKNAHKEESVTINDVLFTALSLAITNYNKYHKCPIQEKKQKKLRCRALLPVALPRGSRSSSKGNDENDDGFNDYSHALRNKWVFVSADMGGGIENDIERLLYVNKKMKQMKTSPVVRGLL